jgi:hypothetical protein
MIMVCRHTKFGGLLMSEKLDRYSTKLLEHMRNFQLTDMIAVGNIVGAEEKEDFDDFLTDVIIKFQELPRNKRKELVKLAKQVSKANDEMTADPNFTPIAPEELAKQMVETCKKAEEIKVDRSKFMSMVKDHTPGDSE